MNVGVDLGSAYVKVSTVGPDGTAVPFEHPDAEPGHGIAVRGDDPRAALLAALRPLGLTGQAPASVVVAVPGRRVAAVREALRGIPGLAGARVLSNAVAAAAWCRRGAEPLDGDLMIADLGAAGCRVELFRIAAGMVAPVHPAGGTDEREFGAAFDRSVLAAAGAAEPQTLLRYRRTASVDDIRQVLEVAAARPRFADAPIFGSGPFTAAAATAAYAPLGRRAQEALRAALSGRDSGPVRLLIIGGMTGFPPAVDGLWTQAVALGVEIIEAPEAPSFVSAYGAALVAAGRVTPGDRCPYPITVRSRRVTGGRLMTRDEPLAAAGELGVGGDTCFAAADGGPLEFTVAPLAAGSPLVDAAGTAWSVAEPARLPTAGTFHVGIRFAAGHPELVLAPVHGGAGSGHRLSTVPTPTFPFPSTARESS